MHWDVVVYIGMLWCTYDVVFCNGMLWSALGCCGHHRDVVVYIGMFLFTL